MSYNQTFEIIIKDIQDIEKLVGNFKNYSRIPKIELDLSLSKLRNVYDLLLMFREADEEIAGNKEFEFIKDIPVGEKEVKAETLSPPEEVPKPEHAPFPSSDKKLPEEPKSEFTPQVENKPVPNEGHKIKMEEKIQEEIVAIKTQKKKEFINEKLGEQTKKDDLISRFQTGPIDKIAGSMGINDKFFFIRELFDGDANKFRLTMDILDHSSDFKAAYDYLVTNFEWDMESSNVHQLLNLIRRKFINRVNE
jgi:hypothetical protein